MEAQFAQMLSGTKFAGNKMFSYKSCVLHVTIHMQAIVQVFANVIQYVLAFPTLFTLNTNISFVE